ncbi:tyrosine-type recombinase/integrase [Clostridium ljungdahlii]|uniref:tyrosine-type recombinase/integrase n=1 Tax=Clostridium ljungdahlii TaxID=1538 RepID=UPI003864D0C6
MKQNEIFHFPKIYCDIAMEYVNYKHSLGFKYPLGEQGKLNSLLKYIYNYSKSEPKYEMSQELVEKYAVRNTSDSKHHLHAKQSTIRQFAIFLNLKGIPAYIYPKELVKTSEDFVPYIFTIEEIQKIIYAADCIKPNKNKFVNTPLIYPAVIRVLYGCGLRISEALSLKFTDVDLENGILVIMNGKNNVSRLVPMSKSLQQYLIAYEFKVNWRENPYFFPALHNEMYSPLTFRNQFYKFQKQANISWKVSPSA